MSREFDFGSLKTKKVEKPHPPIAPPKPIQKQDLKPPKPPMKPVPEQDFFMDFNYLINNSSFQRGITEFIKHTFPAFKGIDHRASKDVMNQQIQVRNNEINEALTIVKQMDTALLNEIRSNSLFLEQKSKHNN